MAEPAGTKLPTTLEEAHAEIVALRAENAALRALVAQLEARVAELEARLSRNSGNSSRPPSSDPPNVKLPPKKEPTGRKPGGQPGHKGHRRGLLPTDECDRVEKHYPERCDNPKCQAIFADQAFRVEVGEPERHQVTETPPIRPETTEHQLYALQCQMCDHATMATLPAGVPTGAFGPRLQSTVALLTGAYRLGKRNVTQLVHDLLGVEMALGSVTACEYAVSAALEAPVAEAHEFVATQAIINADETGWYERAKRAWLWVAVTATVAIFLVRSSRGAGVARELLGKFKGILTTDRWSGYTWWPLARRQLCWAHLIRDFQFIKERGGRPGKIGDALLQQARMLFRCWHRARDGTLSRRRFKELVAPIRPEVERLIKDGAGCGHGKVSGMCWELLAVLPALWTFVDVPGVEPTNNAAERALRHAVIWRKGSHGTHSGEGSRFVERILTSVMSLRLQQRNVLDFLSDATAASLAGCAPPSLLPAAA